MECMPLASQVGCEAHPATFTAAWADVKADDPSLKSVTGAMGGMGGMMMNMDMGSMHMIDMASPPASDRQPHPNPPPEGHVTAAGDELYQPPPSVPLVRSAA